MTFTFPLIFIAIVYIGMIAMNERYGLFKSDHFASPAAKYGAYAWLGAFLFLIAFLVVASSQRVPTAKELAHAPFYSMFMLHALIVLFLI